MNGCRAVTATFGSIIITTDGRSLCAVAHLAKARSQKSGNGILGIHDYTPIDY